MSDKTKIQWCDYTFNPWIGCTKVSPGCRNCYAESQDRFRHWTPDGWGTGKPRKRTSISNWRNVRKWNDLHWWECQACNWRDGFDFQTFTPECPMCGQKAVPTRARVFCASLADWLDNEVEISWLADLLDLIRLSPNLDWLLLTKRPEHWYERLDQVLQWLGRDCGIDHWMDLAGWVDDWQQGRHIPHQIWAGTSVENQERADIRVPALLQIPARVRFLSMEPLLGEVDLSALPNRYMLGEGQNWLNALNNFVWDGSGPDDLDTCTINPVIHWVIVGGESGPNARRFNLGWGRDLLDQCERAKTAFFMKQLGAHPVAQRQGDYQDGQQTVYLKEGTEFRCKDPKGGDITEWPADLQIRQFPTA